MPGQPLLQPLVPPASSGRFVRVEYLDFQNVAEHREFRFRAYGPDRWSEFRLRVPIAAFGAGRVRLQDGPDVCYRKLMQVLAAAETASPELITIDDVDLASYREAHAPVPKHRSWAPSSPPTPTIAPRQLPVATLVKDDIEPPLEEGQRVSHAAFGVGVA